MGVLYFARRVRFRLLARASDAPLRRFAARAALLALCVIGAVGCQGAAPVTTRRLIEHRAMIDFSGLKSPANVEAVRATCALPHRWEAMPLQKTGLFAHQQWRSPSAHTGIGVALIRLPLPLGARTVIWFAKSKYTEKSSDGRLIAEWTDKLGRNWFEAENKNYHVRGYAVAEGFSAWMVYFGYKLNYPPDPAEISLAARCADGIVPQLSTAPKPPVMQSSPRPAR